MSLHVGIDLGSRNVRLVAGTVKGTIFTLDRVISVPVQHSDNLESATLDALSQAASEWGSKSLPKLAGGRFGLSGKELIVRYTQIPQVPLWRLRLLMDFEVREMANQVGDTLASDYNLVSLPNAPEGEDTVLVAVCKETFLQARFDGVKSALAEPAGGLPCSVALFNAFAACGDIKDGEYTFLVDIGDRNVELVLQRDGELLFARNIATGGFTLTDAIKSAFGVSGEDAEKIKHDYGNVTPRGISSYASGKEEKVANAIVGPVGQLSSMIQSSLAFIRAQTKIRDLEIGRILLSGGGANLRGLPDYLSATFRCPVQRFQPENGLDTSRLSAEESALFQTDPGSFAVALGLARTGADDNAFKLELVPATSKKKREFKQRTLFLILSAVAAVIFLAFNFWKLSTEAKVLETKSATERSAADVAKRKRKAFDSEQAQIADLNQKMAVLSGFTEPAWALARVQKLVQDSQPDGVWAESISVKRESVPDPANPKNRLIKTLVRVVGQATPMDGQPDHALAQLVQGMQAAQKGCEVSIVKQTPSRGGPIEFELLVDVMNAGGAP